LGQSFSLQTCIEGLLGDALLGVVDLVKDLFTQDGRLWRCEPLWVKLILDGDGDSMLLSGEVDGEDAVNLLINQNSVSVTKQVKNVVCLP